MSKVVQVYRIGGQEVSPIQSFGLTADMLSNGITRYGSGSRFKVNTSGEYYYCLESVEEIIEGLNTDAGLSIGMEYAGGIIFYLDGNGGGLVVDQTDMLNGTLNTRMALFPVPYVAALGTAVGDGKSNLDTITAYGIANIPGYLSLTTNAFVQVLNHNSGGFTDWFIPSKDELNLIYTNLVAPGIYGLTNEQAGTGPNYWSSSIDIFTSWAQLMYDYSIYPAGAQGVNTSTTQNLVRAVRKF